jgi:hypothetical protein
MSAYATSSGGSPKDAWNAPSRALRLEKTREIGTSCGERDRKHEPTGRSAQNKQKPRASRSETQKHDPIWDGPRLNASFATQVIAQAIGKPASEGLTAHSAYRASAQIPRALLLDRSI